MFKKKCVLPPRPQLPSKQQMVADIVNMDENDPVLYADQGKKVKETENAYQKLKAFLELDDDLSENYSELKNLCMSATTDEKHLKNLSGNLKTQAENVLQKLESPRI